MGDTKRRLKGLRRLERAKQTLSRFPSELRVDAVVSTNGGVVELWLNGGAEVDVDARTNGGAKAYYASAWCAVMDDRDSQEGKFSTDGSIQGSRVS